MFETLTARLNDVFEQLRRRGKLGEADVDAAQREVRLALLAGDLNLAVARDLAGNVRARAVGAAVCNALNPAQQVIKIGHEEVIRALAPAEPLQLSGPRPRVPMLVCLQGAGKTTAAGKLPWRLQTAARILGMGDVIGPIERAEGAMDDENAGPQADRMREGGFDLEDWLARLRQVKKMGPPGQIAEMLRGRARQAALQADPEESERRNKMSEAIICSMTTSERSDPELLNASRRRRIASGSGTDVQDVNRLMKQFRQAQKQLKAMKGESPRELMVLFG